MSVSDKYDSVNRCTRDQRINGITYSRGVVKCPQNLLGNWLINIVAHKKVTELQCILYRWSSRNIVLQAADARRRQQAISNTVSFLEAQLSAVSTDPYALNIISYALTLAGSSQAASAFRMLTSLAIVEGTQTLYFLLR